MNNSVLKDLKNKQRSQLGSTTKKGGSMLTKMVPAFIKNYCSSMTGKQYLDIGLFCGGLFAMYKYGGKLSEQIDQIMPSEEQMTKIFAEMQAQGGQGGMPPM